MLDPTSHRPTYSGATPGLLDPLVRAALNRLDRHLERHGASLQQTAFLAFGRNAAAMAGHLADTAREPTDRIWLLDQLLDQFETQQPSLFASAAAYPTHSCSEIDAAVRWHGARLEDLRRALLRE